MAYNQFTLNDIKQKFGVSYHEQTGLFSAIEPATVSDLLRETLEDSAELGMTIATEKARSEMIIAPILLEVRRHRKGKMSLFSGEELNVDPERGLTGYCDFLLSLSPEQLTVEAPVVAVVEAKNENFRTGMSQCLAEMVAARIFNEKRGRQIPAIYGAVTTGDMWRFLRMRDSAAEVDLTMYYLHDVERIVGVLLAMVDGRA